MTCKGRCHFAAGFENTKDGIQKVLQSGQALIQNRTARTQQTLAQKAVHDRWLLWK